MTFILLPLIALGRFILSGFRHAGAITVFGLKALTGLVRPPFYFRTFFRTSIEIGFLSLPVVALTAIFAGAVIALQSYTGFKQYHAQSAVANIVVLAVTRELGPVLAGLMVAGRVGAALSAQIGTMRVTNQIDALTTLSTNPIKYLVTPRLLAATLAMPVLVLIADILGAFGGFSVSVLKLGIEPRTYISATIEAVKFSDTMTGLVKAAIFGFLIALLGCYHGYNSRGGAEGVGAAATSTVVATSVLILLFDYILTDLFFNV
ncbi:ABC transporter permease [Acetobacteraceae bacterium ESL0709]|nr:ABC transporter permease [Acetobacteraceae bacterium ESL0697]MDF7678955.1 ABC transporter permease [Acetobacteraceae bacterium ESL0709]